MPVQTLCTVAEVVRLNDFAYSLKLDVGEELAAQISCGQFVHIKCGHSRLLRRPISICDWKAPFLRVVFEVRGEGTEWLSRRKVGDEVDVLGPLGHGFDVSGKRLLVVGGGIGVPPVLGCAQYASARGSEVHAILGFRDEAHQMLTQDFVQCCRSLGVISDDGSTGRKGFVTELVEEFLAADAACNGCTAAECADCGGRPAKPVILACGPKAMLKNVAAIAAKYGVECQVSMEERMGCGVGACLVCACKSADGHMKHVCKDGPVFRAEEVDFDD